jgi:hypothetical protein
MLIRTPSWLVVAAVLAFLPALTVRADDYSIKEAKTAPPKEVDKAIIATLAERSIQLLGAKGDMLAELWFPKEIAAKATPEQVKAGLTYRELPETVLLGVVRFVEQSSDYRGQKIKPGVYTMRLAFQPMNGDHMGTAPYNEFALLVPVDDDKKPDPFKEPKELQDLSQKASGTTHPAVYLLFPGKDPGAAPKLVSQPGGHWVLNVKQEVKADGKKTTIVIGLTLIGKSASA